MKRILLVLALLLLLPTVAEAGWRYRYYGGYRPYYRPVYGLYSPYYPPVPAYGAYYTGYGPRYYAPPVYVAPPPVVVAPGYYGYPYYW